jgi:hypothetical protein
VVAVSEHAEKIRRFLDEARAFGCKRPHNGSQQDEDMEALILGADSSRVALAALVAKVEKLERFKAYVHERLDKAGVPTDPGGEHSKHGCRIGDRLDVLLGENERLRTEFERATGGDLKSYALLQAENERLRAERDEARAGLEQKHQAYRSLYGLWLRVARAMTPPAGPDLTDEQVAERAESAADRRALAIRVLAEAVKRAGSHEAAENIRNIDLEPLLTPEGT